MISSHIVKGELYKALPLDTDSAGTGTSVKIDLKVYRALWQVRQAMHAIEQYDHGLQDKGFALYKVPDFLCHIVNGALVPYPTMEMIDAYDPLIEATFTPCS